MKKALTIIKILAKMSVGLLIIGFVFELGTHFDPYMRHDSWLRNLLMFCWILWCIPSPNVIENNEKK